MALYRRPAVGPVAAYPLLSADAGGRLPILSFVVRDRTADAVFLVI
jgi:hypothetical protein